MIRMQNLTVKFIFKNNNAAYKCPIKKQWYIFNLRKGGIVQ